MSERIGEDILLIFATICFTLAIVERHIPFVAFGLLFFFAILVIRWDNIILYFKEGMIDE